jgi:acyl-CoA reductase-like NAD-dependent aldehyde dehydrogenase
VPHFPVLRWGEPYESLDVAPVIHFATGEPLGEVSQANAGMVVRDMRKAPRAREALLEISIPELCQRLGKAANLFLNEDLGSIAGTPADFVKSQSATTGLPEHMCRANMAKLHHVLTNLSEILGALTRRVMRSRQATAPALGLVLPSNSPGTHGLWMPVIALQIGLVIKPGSQEPWTPFRMAQAFFEAGIPPEAFGFYPGDRETAKAVLDHTRRTMIFGSKETVDQYRGDPGVQVHGPGFSKIILGDDVADAWRDHLDLMVDSVLVNGGRSCINCSSIWTPRHAEEIADAIAERLGPIGPLPPTNDNAKIAAFTNPKVAEAVDAQIEQQLSKGSTTEITANHRGGRRLVREERCAYLRPTVVHAPAPDAPLANTEYMFPFVSVVECPSERVFDEIGPTLVGTVITDDEKTRRRAVDCPDIDRLNLGPIPTYKLDWLQPHEGNLIDFLFRERALQIA